MTTYFTSDTHLGHAKILELGKGRPLFKTVSEMNEMIILWMNQIVQPDDTLIHLGDVAMGPKELHEGWIRRLPGHKILVRGNHDQSEGKMRNMGFDEVYTSKTMEIDGKRVYLRHIPPRELDPYSGRFYKTEFMPEAPPADQYDYWLCGHVHSAFKRRGNVINVGVDVWDFKPRTFAELTAAVDGT